jgi:hypothetical protein
LQPSVDRGPLNAESLSDFFDAYGLGHAHNCTQSIDNTEHSVHTIRTPKRKEAPTMALATKEPTEVRPRTLTGRIWSIPGYFGGEGGSVTPLGDRRWTH